MATAESVGRRLDQIFQLDEIGALLAEYFRGGDAPFAGATFDNMGSNPDEQFTSDDVLAVTLLDVVLSPPAVRLLLEDGFADVELAEVRCCVDLWEAEESDLSASFKLIDRLKRLPGVGPTKATKLTARKRSRLCPIYDSVVARVMSAESGPWRVPLAEALASDRRRERIIEASSMVQGFTPSVIRTVDVAIWMVGSNATTAKDARELVGLQRQPLW